ncbi:MAG: single-stranded-DNA-specific exonuclease RecJ [Pirellulaceae bacterium]|nr:single-stranded-DNA-specific exonuclease RecJ [Pirellulaceae bacterium]
MAKRWQILPHDSFQVEQLEARAKVPPVVAQLLLGRGISDPVAIRAFLDAKLTGLHEPELLPGIPSAVDRIFAALESERRIVIYGDYDADGMTATSVLYRCLQILGADVGYYVPNRLEDGYGLNEAALQTLHERGASLVISVDCGITSIGPATKARELGLELIVTDHHPLADSLPTADTIVHPQLPGTDYPFHGLCGAGVALKLAWALCQRSSQSKKVTDRLRNFLLTAVGIAAIGTVADVVPLLDENRVLVRHGLKCLRQFPVPGLAALMRVTKLDTKPSLSSEDIGFTIAPRLNAAGRLGQAQLAVELLTTDSDERATALAEYIHELNSSRDSLERSIYLAASKQIKEHFEPEKDAALVLSGRGWHAGVIGIVASRFAEKYNRPVVVIALDSIGAKPGTGSGRSACGLNLQRAFQNCTDFLVSHGGHAAAAGLRIEESQVDAFRAAFVEYAATEIKAGDREPLIEIDAESPLSQLTLQTVQQIEQLAPFGQGNPRPILCASDIELAEPPKRMGGGERHLSVSLRQYQTTLRAVAFGRGDWVDELNQLTGTIDIAYRPVINEFRGRRTVELHLVDWRPSRTTATVGVD